MGCNVPNRIVRDAVLDSERYHGVDKTARLAFHEMILCADDYGLLPVSRVFLRRHLTAFDGLADQAISAVLMSLSDVDLIRTYASSQGGEFAFIPRFGNVPRATKPKWPVPPMGEAFSSVHEMLCGQSKRVWYYVYMISHIPSGSFYIGSRSSTKHPDDDPYFGSGAISKWLSANRDDCRKEVLSEHPSMDAARAVEALMIAERASDSLCLNVAGTGMYSVKNQQVSGILHSNGKHLPTSAPETETETETETEILVLGRAVGSHRASATTAVLTLLGDEENLKAIQPRAMVSIGGSFELPSDWGRDAEALGWKPSAILKESEKFRQYWVSGKGSGTRRTVKGWRQSWSNWLAKAEKYA